MVQLFHHVFTFFTQTTKKDAKDRGFAPPIKSPFPKFREGGLLPLFWERLQNGFQPGCDLFCLGLADGPFLRSASYRRQELPQRSEITPTRIGIRFRFRGRNAPTRRFSFLRRKSSARLSKGRYPLKARQVFSCFPRRTSNTIRTPRRRTYPRQAR